MNTVNQKDKAKSSTQHPEHFSGTHVEIDPGRSPVKSFFKLLGPGLITGASDDDPSGIATYSIPPQELRLDTQLSGRRSSRCL